MSDENEYTPTLDQLRDLWVDHLLNPLPRLEGIELVPDVQAAFDQMVAEHDTEVAAKATGLRAVLEKATKLINSDINGPLWEYEGLGWGGVEELKAILAEAADVC